MFCCRIGLCNVMKHAPTLSQSLHSTGLCYFLGKPFIAINLRHSECFLEAKLRFQSEEAEKPAAEEKRAQSEYRHGVSKESKLLHRNLQKLKEIIDAPTQQQLLAFGDDVTDGDDYGDDYDVSQNDDDDGYDDDDESMDDDDDDEQPPDYDSQRTEDYLDLLNADDDVIVDDDDMTAADGLDDTDYQSIMNTPIEPQSFLAADYDVTQYVSPLRALEARNDATFDAPVQRKRPDVTLRKQQRARAHAQAERLLQSSLDQAYQDYVDEQLSSQYRKFKRSSTGFKRNRNSGRVWH